MVVLLSGEITAPSLTTAIIDAEATGRVLVTREYLTGATSGTTTLSGLTDTTFDITPTDGQSLTWNNTASSWSATTVAGGGATTLTGLTDTELSATTGGYVLSYDSATQKWIPIPNVGGNDYVDSASFNINDGVLTLNRLSGGTATVDLDNRYAVTSGTSSQFIKGDGSLESDTFYSQTGHTHTLSGLTDTTFAITPTDGQSLTWNDSASSWTATTVSSGGGGNDYITSGSFNTSSGVITLNTLTGGTVDYGINGKYLDLSGGTLTGDLSGTTVYVSGSSLSYQENLVVDSASTETIATVPIGICTAVFFDYVVSSGSTNIRAGTVMSAHDGASATYTDNSTTDLGDTTDVVLSVDVSGGNLRLLADATTDGWIIKTLIRTI
jgi:hypothetical protein